MKRIKQITIIALLLGTILPSCTVQKRLHMKGVHVEWNTSKLNSKESVKETESFKKKNVFVKDEIVENYKNTEIKISSEIELSNSESEFVNLIDDNKVNQKIKNNDDVSSNLNKTVDNQEVFSNNTINEVRKKVKKKQYDDESSEGGKSQIIALILVLVVGAFGIHRFYLGHIGIGILMLLTGGLCGLLILIDLIRIVTGDLKPKGGDYTEKF